MVASPEFLPATAQLARVAELLPQWCAVPLYRRSCRRDFSRWPLISKQDLRENFPHNFLQAGQSLETLLASHSLELEHTSGSSDERTAVLFGRGWWNEQEARVLRLNGLVAQVLAANPSARRATLVPPVCNGLVCFSNYTAKSARTVGTTLFVNQARIPFLVPPAEFARMAAEIQEWSPAFLDLDPVHGAWFALYCERAGITFPSVKFILCSYEFVSVVHRKIIARVFGVPVFNFYGATETGHLLMENEHGEMRASHETVFYELIEADEVGVGSLVVTTLTNDVMPLVRYRVGDLVERRVTAAGENFFVHGRARDALVRGDGRRVTTGDMDRCFSGVDGIAHYQLRQAASGDCALQMIPDREPPTAAALKQLQGELQNRLQLDRAIAISTVAKLPPLPSGKFRLTARLDS